jgi:hypothetical protein
MSMSTWAELVFLEGAVLGIALGVRTDRLQPHSLLAAFLCIIAGLSALVTTIPLLDLIIALHRLGAGMAILTSILPVACVTFGLIALGMRGLIQTARPGLR